MSDFENEYTNIIDDFTPISTEYKEMTDCDSIVHIIGRDVILSGIGTIVKGDSNSQMITFMANRYYDGIDLSKMSIFILYKTENNIYTSNAVNISISDTQIKFNWIISGNVTESLNTTALIQFSGTNEKSELYILKTKLFNLKIEDSILSTELSTENFEDWFVEINNRVTELENTKVDIPEKEMIEVVNKHLAELDLIASSKTLKSISATKKKTTYNIDDEINIDDIEVTAT